MFDAGQNAAALKDGNGASAPSLRELNRRRVVDVLREVGVASRADIARATGLSRSTISSLVSEMRESGLVVDHPSPEQGDRPPAGRPPALIGLGRPAGAAIGIDFGKRHLAVAIADLAHIVLAEARREIPEDLHAAEAMDSAAELVDEVLGAARMSRGDVIGVGLGLPGPIHRRTGRAASPEILPGWVGLRIQEEMEDRLDLRVQADNDANLGALAELFWGAGQDAADLIYIKVATGVGAGLVVGGRLFHGVGGTAGEIGHATIDEQGPICRCGNRGCLETFAAAPAIVDLLRRSLGHDLTIEAIVERARDGDAGCRRAIADSGRHIGRVLADVCNLLNPQRVVVGGSVGQAGDVLLDEMREVVRRTALPTAAEDVEIVPGVLGERAEVLGAVALILGTVEEPALRAAGAGR